MDLTKNIKTIRETKGIRPSDIARRIGVDPTNYPKIEKRGNKLTYEMLEKIAEALEVTVIDILTVSKEGMQTVNDTLNTELDELREQVVLISQERDQRIEKAKLYLDAFRKDRKSIDTTEDSTIVKLMDHLSNLISISIGVEDVKSKMS